MRLFVAVDLSEAARAALGEVGERLREVCRRAGVKARFPRAEHLHLTLAFLGEVDASHVDEICASLAAVSSTDRFEIAFGGLGAFPSKKNPIVLWVGVTKGAKELKSLAEQVDRSLRELGLDLESREYQPHLTLARVQHPPQDTWRVVHPVSLEGPVSSPVTEVVLFRSELGRMAPQYTPLGRFPLRSHSQADDPQP